MRSTEHLLMIRLGDAQRRNTDPIPLCKSLCAICPLFIDTDFAIAQQSVQMAFGDAFAKTEQKIVDTLPGATVVYLNHCQAQSKRVTMIQVDDRCAGQRIDNFLFRLCKGVPKSHLYRLLRNGEIRVNKKRADCAQRLA